MKSYTAFYTPETRQENHLRDKRNQLKQLAFEAHLSGLINCGSFGKDYSDTAISALDMAAIEAEIERLQALTQEEP